MIDLLKLFNNRPRLYNMGKDKTILEKM